MADPHDDHDENELIEEVGDEDDDAHCGPPTETDVVDDELDAIVDHLLKAGYDEEFSQNAVFSAIAHLVETNEGEDTPELDESMETKQVWVARHAPRIRRSLREDFRLKFAEE